MQQARDHATELRPAEKRLPMSLGEYQKARAELKATYGEEGQAETRREQELARLFYRSGWTQVELAKVEKKSQSHVAKVLRFGRFLEFSSAELNSELDGFELTERKFRGEWEKTDLPGLGDRQRFERVLERLTNPPPEGFVHAKELRRSAGPANKLGKAIRDKFCDGAWHMLDEIAEAVEADVDAVKDRLDEWSEPTSGMASMDCERVKVGRSAKYRMFGKKKSVSPIEIKQKLSPLIIQLKDECNKTEATISRAQLALIASHMQRLIDHWES